MGKNRKNQEYTLRDIMADQILRDLYCYHCSLQFDVKLVYDMHQSIKHNYRADEKSVQNFIKCEFNLHEEHSTDKNQDNIIMNIKCSIIKFIRYST